MRYTTIQEAIDIANGTRYGLGASVFGPDQRLAMKVARRLECGMVAINDFGVFYVRFTCEHKLFADISDKLSSQLKCVHYSIYPEFIIDVVIAKTYRLGG